MLLPCGLVRPHGVLGPCEYFETELLDQSLSSDLVVDGIVVGRFDLPRSA